ncbi:MAG: hypothetical protein E6Q97_36045 [Desulfurellales bacterium]|nr:MAG: hypothetical protein E6Q97_36045 [Desulfurellales bacterium]
MIDPNKTPAYITHTTQRSVGGAFFALMIKWDRTEGGFWDIWRTGVGRYDNIEDAAEEARWWADAEGLPYYDPIKKELHDASSNEQAG